MVQKKQNNRILDMAWTDPKSDQVTAKGTGNNLNIIITATWKPNELVKISKVFQQTNTTNR